MSEIFQKRIYELVEYIQLISTEPGYESPGDIWLSLDKPGWDEAKKFSLMEFMYDLIGDMNKYYLNDGEPYADVAEVIASFPFEFRTPYYKVNIMGVDYWFLPDKITLVPYIADLALADNSVTVQKLADMPSGTLIYRRSPLSGDPEYTTLAQLRIDLNIPEPSVANVQNIYTVNLPAGASIAERLLTAVVPAGWTFTAVGEAGKNLQIVHTLTGRQISHVSVKATDLSGDRMLVPFRDAYSGILENDETIVIEGLAPNDLPLILILIFNQ